MNAQIHTHAHREREREKVPSPPKRAKNLRKTLGLDGACSRKGRSGAKCTNEEPIKDNTKKKGHGGVL
jgi:hypothetical protein